MQRCELSEKPWSVPGGTGNQRGTQAHGTSSFDNAARERRDVMSKEMVYVMKRINGKEDHYISDRIKERKKQAKRNLKERKEWK